MLLIHGILFHNAFPALGILPQAASVLLGSMLLYRESIAALGSPVQALSAANVFFADVTLAVCYMAFLIPTWILLSNMWREEGSIILGTYGSVFMMVNFIIHFYFAAAEALHIVTTRQSPFKSLAAEYIPLNSDYSDGLGDIEEGN